MLVSCAFGLVLMGTRLSAMLLSAPVLGHRAVPVPIRILLAGIISLAAAPLTFSDPQTVRRIATISNADWVGALFSEAMIGGLIGLGVLIIFSSAQMVGSAVGQLSGIQMDSFTNSDSGFGQFPTSQLIGILAAAVYVLIGGPEMLIAAVLESFQWIPVGQSIGSGSAVELVVKLLNQSFDLTVRAIAPAIGTIVASTFLVGFLARTLPQLNLIQLGLSSNVTIMMLAIFLTLGGCVWLVVDELELSLTLVRQSLEKLNHPPGK